MAYYEKLLNEVLHNDIDIYEEPMQPRIKGLYSDNVIWLNKNLPTNVEKAVVLAEELGHYHTTVGNILDQSNVNNRKQEKMARKWAWDYLVTPKKLIEACEDGCRSMFEIAEMLDITEDFLKEGLTFYKEKYGTQIQVDDNHILYLDPLGVLKLF